MGVFLLGLMMYSVDQARLPQLHSGVQTVYDAVIDDDGNVNYQKLADQPDLVAKLEAYASFIAQLEPEKLDEPSRIAYYGNAYNVFTLLGVTRHWPVTSVRKIRPLFGFFTRDEWLVGGKTLSLNKLEKEYLRPLDPRIHFIINCASVSCPVLDKQVLTPENVEAVMTRAAANFLADEEKNEFGSDGTWQLSKIFDWYREDWGKEHDVVAYIRSVRPELRKPKKIKYKEYDWAINTRP